MKINMKQGIIGIAAVMAIIIGFFSIKIIPTGYVGIISTMGQIDESPLQPGTHFTIPMINRVQKVCTKQTDYNYPDKVWSETSERTAVYFEGVTVTTSVNPDRAVWLVSNVADYENAVTSGMVQSAIKSASKGFNDIEVTNRSKIEPAAQEALQKAIDEKYGDGTITVNRLVITQADFDPEYNAAILSKQKAELKKEEQAVENQILIDKAETEAKALKTKAEAEAEANRLLNDSLTENVIEYNKVEKWNGKLPQVTSGGVMIDLTESTE